MSAPPRTKFTSPFAPLQLFESDTKTLEQLSSVLVSNYVTQYEQYVADGGSASIDEREWKFIKQRDNVRVFGQRTKQNDDSALDEIRQSIDSYADSGIVQPPDMPTLLTVGSVAGTLDDIMYGMVAPTVDVMRIKTSYTDDHFGDVAVLKTIAVPTEDDPFQSLMIKWYRNRLNLVRRSILSYRDFVYLDRTGITYTSKGERLGFHLLHSIHFPQTHELPPVRRGNMSVCTIYRGDPERNQVEVFVRAITDPGGNAPKSMIIRAGAEMYIAIAKYVECSYHKKLMWLLRLKQQKDGQSSKFSLDALPSESLGPCAMCKRLPSRISSVLGNDSRKCRCALCSKFVCSSCRVKKTLSQVTATTSKLVQREFPFCTACYSEAVRSDAFTAALQEFVLSPMDEAGGGDLFEFRDDLYSLTSSSACS